MTKYKLPFGKNGWGYERTPDMSGKTVVITGGNSGIGLEAAKIMVSKNAHVTIFFAAMKKRPKQQLRKSKNMPLMLPQLTMCLWIWRR